VTVVDLPVAAMNDARLVLTDDLIRAALRREKAALKEARRRRVEGSEPKPNANRKAVARGAAEKPHGADEGDSNDR